MSFFSHGCHTAFNVLSAAGRLRNTAYFRRMSLAESARTFDLSSYLDSGKTAEAYRLRRSGWRVKAGTTHTPSCRGFCLTWGLVQREYHQ